MAAVAIAAAGALYSASGLAQDWDCSDAGNLPQQGMNWCAAQDYREADAALNVAYGEAMTQMRSIDSYLDEGDKGAADNLLKAQRAWIDYRDGHCAAEGYMAHGGSLEPLLVATCLQTVTENRTKELLDLAAGMEGR